MEEIKVGDYYRTKNGLIRKVETIKSGKRQFTRTTKTLVNGRHKLEDIKKHRKNIIDLIEVGDILQINKEKYEVVYDRSYNKLGLLIPNREKLGIRHCSLQYIFSKQGISEFKNIRVVTKEQFSNIEYRLEN